MDKVSEIEPVFYLPAECWDKILFFSIKRFEEFRSVNQTCHLLRTLVSHPSMIKALFKQPIQEVMGGAPVSMAWVVAFLERHVSQESSGGLVLDFSGYRGVVSSQDLTRVFQSFPKLSGLNLCVNPLIFPLRGLCLLQHIAQNTALPSPLEVTVWKSHTENKIYDTLQSQYPAWKVVLVDLPFFPAIPTGLMLGCWMTTRPGRFLGI